MPNPETRKIPEDEYGELSTVDKYCEDLADAVDRRVNQDPTRWSTKRRKQDDYAGTKLVQTFTAVDGAVYIVTIRRRK